ncbi:MAG: hypothetical protein JWP29_3999, partial [Rhodoferax sp.]|nr:hypothetical protein [Rhodoferax sp.]
AHLSAITAAAGEVRAGAPGAQIPLLHSSADVHHLSTSLHGMTQRLMHQQEETEQVVRERTHELEMATLELANQARTDPMTGLLNRRGFEPQWQHAIALARRSGRPLSAVMVDIDHFKRVNDNFGHEAGDEVIKHLARTLTTRLRSTDLVARLGGEEFVAMLPDTDIEGARLIAQQLVDAMAAELLPVAGQVTISAGVADLAEVLDGPTLLRHADEALYLAKRSGRNRVCGWVPTADTAAPPP